MSVLKFVPLSEQPHNTSVLGCGACGHYWVGVWPAKTQVSLLECPRCHVQGQALIDPPRNADDPVEGQPHD